MAATVVFRTPRLVGRQLEDTDVDELLAVYGDGPAMRWVGDGQPLARADCERWLEVTRRNYALRGYGMNAIVDAATAEVIGFCGLVHPGGQPEAEVKYALKRRHWGAGFATEAVRALLDHGARAWGLREVIATTAPQNLASHRVLLKAGLRRAELRRNDDGSDTQVFRWAAPDA